MVEAKLEVSHLPEKTFEKGQILIEEGAPGDKVFVLKEGCVSIIADGKEICKLREPMTILGEISLLLETNASARVLIEEDSAFYVIDNLAREVENTPSTALYISKILAQRVVDMNKYYVQIKKEVEQLEKNPAARVSKKLWDVIVRLDRFWGREII